MGIYMEPLHRAECLAGDRAAAARFTNYRRRVFSRYIRSANSPTAVTGIIPRELSGKTSMEPCTEQPKKAGPTAAARFSKSLREASSLRYMVFALRPTATTASTLLQGWYKARTGTSMGQRRKAGSEPAPVAPSAALSL